VLDSDGAIAQLARDLRTACVRLRALRLAGLKNLSQKSRKALQSLGFAGWAFPVATVGKGCILLSCPNIGDAAVRPHQLRAVVLVLSNDQGATVGVVLNKPTSILLCQLPWCVKSRWVPIFDGETLFFGGDVGHDVNMLHGHRALGGLEVVDDIYIGHSNGDIVHDDRLGPCILGPPLLDENCRYTRERFTSDTMRWLQGHCHWAPGELAHEIAAGHWIAAQCHRGYLLPSRGSESDVWSELHLSLS